MWKTYDLNKLALQLILQTKQLKENFNGGVNPSNGNVNWSRKSCDLRSLLYFR